MIYNNNRGEHLMVNELIAECTDYDVKISLETKKPKSWLKTVSAFANGIGGKIFFGVDEDKKIHNITNPQEVIEKITDFIDKNITPAPLYKITPFKEGNEVFIELLIQPGSSTPYYYTHEATKIAFIRSGSSSVEAPTYILNELILKGTGKTYDGLITSFLKKDFSFSILERDFYERTCSKFTEQDYISFGLATKDGYLTNAGVLLADSNDYRHSRLFCTRWNGYDKTNENEVDNDKEFDGSLIRQLKLALDFFDANTKIGWHKNGDETIYTPDYDKEAILEALVNGIIHRNYNNTGAEVCLNIYEDRIEITSPGIMVSGDPVPQHIDYTFESMRRNPIIADVFWKMRYMNRRGSGLAKITSATNKLFNDNKNHVNFQIRNSFFVVTIENANYVEKSLDQLTERQKRILEILKAKETTISDIAKIINADRKTVRGDLTYLESLKLVSSSGTTKDKIWKA